MLNGRKMKDFISYKKKKNKDIIFLRYKLQNPSLMLGFLFLKKLIMSMFLEDLI